MQVQRPFPDMTDVYELTADTIYFRNGGELTIRRLTEDEWHAIDASDPRRFIAEVLQRFVLKNRIGFGIMANLLREQIAEDDTPHDVFKFVPNLRPGSYFSDRRTRLIPHRDCAQLSRCAQAQDTVPLRLLVLVARLVGVPEQVLLERGSKAAEERRKHLAQRAVGQDLSEEELALYHKIRPHFDALPLRHEMAPSEMLALYRALKSLA